MLYEVITGAVLSHGNIINANLQVIASMRLSGADAGVEGHHPDGLRLDVMQSQGAPRALAQTAGDLLDVNARIQQGWIVGRVKGTEAFRMHLGGPVTTK